MAEKAETKTVNKKAANSKPRFEVFYNTKVLPVLLKELKIKNPNGAPRLEKIILNMGLGDVKDNSKSFNLCVEEMAIIAGQKPVVTLAKKSVSNFKLREGMKIGAKVTLRGDQMYEFYDRLVSIALPRVRDFRGISPKSFDGKGNFSLGVKEQLIFPEISYEKIEKVRGFDVCIVTSAKTDKEAKLLLELMGMPFKSR